MRDAVIGFASGFGIGLVLGTTVGASICVAVFKVMMVRLGLNKAADALKRRADESR